MRCEKLFSVLVFVALAFLAGCTPPRQEIQTFWEQTPVQAPLAASAHAADVGGVAYLVAPTGSMEPFITGGDYVVVKPIPYEELQTGMLANYQARWLPADSPTVTHWVAAKQGSEFIMDGQHNAHYERTSEMRMGRKEFRGIVVGIYTQRKKS